MQIGQIVYNVEDYVGHGGLVSSSAINPFTSDYIVEDQSENNLDEGTRRKINIYEDILNQCGIKEVKKLGIQAPPGTKFQIDPDYSSNPIYLIVGRTGIYELDLTDESSNSLKYLSFIRPQNYVLDESDSFARVSEGITKMNESKNKFDKEIKQLQDFYGTISADTDTGKTFWKEYDRLYQDYCIEHENARALYLQGVNGVYHRGSEGDLQNIIIDFYYELKEA